MSKDFIFLLRQHIGSPSVPVVALGSCVERGTVLAEAAEGALSLPLHSSVSGLVTKISEEAIFVKPDAVQNENFIGIEGKDKLDLVKNAGLAGLGGAGFPTYMKLSKKLAPGGTVILNAAECEPLLDHNMARLRKSAPQVLQGLFHAMDIVGAEKGIIAIKARHHEEIALLQKACEGGRANDARLGELVIHTLPDEYPVGEERAVIRETLGVLLGTDQLPLAANAIVMNAETAFRMAEAIDLKKPLMDKDLTVAGRLKDGEPHIFLDVPIGKPVEEILNEAGGVLEDAGELIMGGPFTGKSVLPEAPVIKTTGGLLATMPFLHEKEPLGLLVCACGASEARMREMSAKMNATVCGVVRCKNAEEIRGSLKCHNPGHCPGQSQKVLELRKMGAKALLTGTCMDCTNTVMTLAPALHLRVYHTTDGALRAGGLPLYRKRKLHTHEED